MYVNTCLSPSEESKCMWTHVFLHQKKVNVCEHMPFIQKSRQFLIRVSAFFFYFLWYPEFTFRQLTILSMSPAGWPRITICFPVIRQYASDRNGAGPMIWCKWRRSVTTGQLWPVSWDALASSSCTGECTFFAVTRVKPSSVSAILFSSLPPSYLTVLQYCICSRLLLDKKC